MMRFKPIVGLVMAGLLSMLAACGQKGNLVLPNEAAAQNRATLPQALRPSAPAASAPQP